jgi:hypothetical protein
MHLPIRLEADAPGRIDQVRKYYKEIFLMLPGMPARIFEKETPGAKKPPSRSSSGRMSGTAPIVLQARSGRDES